MNYELTLRKETEFDIAEHFGFYEGKRGGLGQVFLLRLLCLSMADSRHITVKRNNLTFIVKRYNLTP